MGAYLARQFEFVKSQWHNDGNFAGLADEKDLIAGANDGSGTFTIPSARSAGACMAYPGL